MIGQFSCRFNCKQIKNDLTLFRFDFFLNQKIKRTVDSDSFDLIQNGQEEKIKYKTQIHLKSNRQTNTHTHLHQYIIIIKKTKPRKNIQN